MTYLVGTDSTLAPRTPAGSLWALFGPQGAGRVGLGPCEVLPALWGVPPAAELGLGKVSEELTVNRKTGAQED